MKPRLDRSVTYMMVRFFYVIFSKFKMLRFRNTNLCFTCKILDADGFGGFVTKSYFRMILKMALRIKVKKFVYLPNSSDF